MGDQEVCSWLGHDIEVERAFPRCMVRPPWKVAEYGSGAVGESSPKKVICSSYSYLANGQPFKLLGITYLVGKIKFKLLFQGPLAK